MKRNWTSSSVEYLYSPLCHPLVCFYLRPFHLPSLAYYDLDSHYRALCSTEEEVADHLHGQKTNVAILWHLALRPWQMVVLFPQDHRD